MIAKLLARILGLRQCGRCLMYTSRRHMHSSWLCLNCHYYMQRRTDMGL